MQLGIAGEYNGKTVISTKQMNEIHKPQMIRPQANAMATQSTYGFGWNIYDYKGKRVLTHGGATDGFNTSMYLMPEINLGIIVVGNTFNSLGNAIANQVMDAFLGENDTDWRERYLYGYKNAYARATEARQKIHDARIKNTKPTLILNDYTGIYESEGYGKVEVILSGNSLKLKFW